MKKMLGCLTVIFILTQSGQATPLTRELGYQDTDRLLIINADDAGLSHGTNQAIMDAMSRGLVQSASVMPNTPWFRHFVAESQKCPRRDVGVHLTFTSEWEGLRWAPLLGPQVPSLLDKQGYCHASVADFRANAKPEQVEAEARAQIQKALNAGIDVTHLDLHMHAMALVPAFFDIYVKLAKDFRLPVRFIASSEALYEKQHALLDAAHVRHPDHLLLGGDVEPGETLTAFWKRKLKGLKPGLTELYIHVAQDTPDLRDMLGSEPFRTGWRDRVEEYRLFTDDASIKEVIRKEKIILVPWKKLQELQRIKKRHD